MKNLNRLIICFILFVPVLSAYSQAKQYKDVFICNFIEGKIIIDENLFDQFDQSEYDSNYTNCSKLAEKYFGKETSGSHYFDKYLDAFAGLTKLKIGTEFYVSTSGKVFKSKVTGYLLWQNQPMGFQLNPVLENSIGFTEDTVDYIRNVFICSKHKNVSKIDYFGITGNSGFRTASAFLAEYDRKFVQELGEEVPAEIKVYEANFLNSDKKEYAVSYQKRLTFESFGSGIFIVSEIGKIMKTIQEMKNDFSYYKLVGVVDYDGDGQYELFGENGYYEGSGYVIYKLINGKYEVIASGFFWGV